VKTGLQLGIAVALVVSAVVGFALRDASASGVAGVTIDRTLACTVLPAGVGAVKAAASSKSAGPFSGPSPAMASVATGNGDGEALAEVHAGKFPGSPNLSIDVNICHRAKTRVPLTARGLSGGPATLPMKATCLTARQILVHLRAVMASKPRWTSKPPLQIAYGTPLSAGIAVRTLKQKPLVYMTIKGDTARFYSAASCF